jgi:hypothetical protein
MKPTKEQIVAARRHIEEVTIVDLKYTLTPQDREALAVLLAATESPPDMPRPNDIVELTALVAAELRAHNVQALARKTRLHIAALRINRLGPWASMWIVNLAEEHLDKSPREIVNHYLVDLANTLDRPDDRCHDSAQ